jgi:hypothetical protein
MFDVLNYLKAFFIGKFNTFVTIGSLLQAARLRRPLEEKVRYSMALV